MNTRSLTRYSMVGVFTLAVVLGGSLLSSSVAGADSTDPGVLGVDSSFTSPNIFPDMAMGTPDLGIASQEATQVAVNDGLALAQSPIPLSEVDLSTGTIAGSDINTTLSSDATTTIALAGVGALAVDSSQLIAQASSLQAQQQAQSSSGCPTSAPANTMRSGAPAIETLCTTSVAQARSTQAAAAIKWALNNLGVPYSQPNRNLNGYFDCSSFVTRAYEAAGVPIAPAGVNAPTTFVIASAAWAIHESLSSAVAGDLVEPNPDHVVMLLAGGYIVQASMPGDVTNVTALNMSAPYLVVWINPANA